MLRAEVLGLAAGQGFGWAGPGRAGPGFWLGLPGPGTVGQELVPGLAGPGQGLTEAGHWPGRLGGLIGRSVLGLGRVCPV